ncbi:MAG: hypothetical protein QM731_07300 [Chitinophagaceae bacterium]
MKKFLLLATTVAFYMLSYSQDDDIVIRGTSKISANLAPKVVVDSLHKVFPDARSVVYFKTPATAAKNGWTVTEDDNLEPGDDVDYYTIQFKRADMKYYALYAANGKLVRSKLEQTVTNLPTPVKTSMKNLGSTHPGYTVTSRTYYKNINHSNKQEYYEIIAQNGKTKKRLYYKADGTLIKVKG